MLDNISSIEVRAMKTFVLVHGGWHGGWCWTRVARLLRSQGHDVFTPTLTGLGERAHLLSSATTLQTGVEDIIGVLEAEELRDIVLVGHSAGQQRFWALPTECRRRSAPWLFWMA